LDDFLFVVFGFFDEPFCNVKSVLAMQKAVRVLVCIESIARRILQEFQICNAAKHRVSLVASRTATADHTFGRPSS
jgi:hypothetical protein